ncbi:MAG: hypothetical protein VXZ96_17860 [Myxococcota bacterium]|nr:hypothetical protein [Myxococcota bacterium]
MNFLLCQSCGQHYWVTESHCPHCQTSAKTRWVRGSTNAAVTLLLGLGIVGCSSDADDKDPVDTADTSDNLLQPADEPEYGVPDTGPDTGMDTAVGPEYGVPDTGGLDTAVGPEYGVPDTGIDTGDTDDTGDTSDTGESDDTSDTGDNSDSSDTGDTDTGGSSDTAVGPMYGVPD